MRLVKARPLCLTYFAPCGRLEHPIHVPQLWSQVDHTFLVLTQSHPGLIAPRPGPQLCNLLHGLAKLGCGRDAPTSSDEWCDAKQMSENSGWRAFGCALVQVDSVLSFLTPCADVFRVVLVVSYS